ncbi:MAG: peptidoglycan-binding protein [Clostridia bacterium]|nr:peptidoglycan-binding protein [Clostridia bacterium]
MKKFLYTLAVAFFVLFICTNANAVSSGNYGTVVTDDVNMRTEPNLSGEIVVKVPLYATLELISLEDGWYHVVYGEYVGYIRSDLVFADFSGTRSAYVLTDGAKLYGMPSQDAYTVKELEVGQALKIRSLTGEWLYAVAGDEYGYILSSELTLSKPGSSTLEVLLKNGMQGDDVKKLQKKLAERGFLSLASITGYYGSETRKAVAEFQEICGMVSDGIAGDETIQAMYDPNNKVTHETAQYNRVKGTVELLDWFKGGSDWLHKGSYFVVTDVNTGLSFNVRRFGGWYHADSEPVTAADTAVMKKIAGGRWSWDRRAIWVTYKGRTVAASMHCMPHMANPTSSNNFDGHFCIHLLNSKVHANSKECPRHQYCVNKAYAAGKK